MKRPWNEKIVHVIDDDQDGLEVLTEILEYEGYRVIGSTSAKQALEFLHSTEQSPHVILLDLMLPGMNGWEFRAEQNKSARLREIPIIIVSAHKDAESVARVLEVADFVAKPIQLPQLLDKLRRVLR